MKKQWSEWVGRAILMAGVLSVLPGPAARADELTGADRLLCTAIQATVCQEAGECEMDLPWNLKVPQFIEVDLKARRLGTTKASGENRSTPIEHVRRENGTIVLQGYERGRAFSFVIKEDTGAASVAVASSGKSVAVFAACTPIPVAR